MALYKIGELAQQSGVATKTIRFYSDSGLLPPTTVTDAGYRLYSDADRARLALIRSLRELDLDLDTIKRLLAEQTSLEAVLRLHLETTELQVRQLQRQRTVLRAALAQSEQPSLAYLQRAQRLARWKAHERQQFLDDHLEQAFTDVAADPHWKAQFRQHAILDLPEIKSEAQLEAWLELADLASDPDFIRTLNELGRASWTALKPDVDITVWQTDINHLYERVAQAQAEQIEPTSASGLPLVAEYVAIQQQLLRWGAEPDFLQRLLHLIEQGSDPRAARYWELLALIREQPLKPYAQAQAWLTAGVQAFVQQKK